MFLFIWSNTTSIFAYFLFLNSVLNVIVFTGHFQTAQMQTRFQTCWDNLNTVLDSSYSLAPIFILVRCSCLLNESQVHSLLSGHPIIIQCLIILTIEEFSQPLCPLTLRVSPVYTHLSEETFSNEIQILHSGVRSIPWFPSFNKKFQCLARYATIGQAFSCHPHSLVPVAIL